MLHRGAGRTSPLLFERKLNMTVKEIVTMFKEEKPNKVSDPHIIQWFNECEAEVQEMLHIPVDEWVSYTVEDLNDGMDTRPVARPPYDKLYLFYLFARLDFANQDMDMYANDHSQFASMMVDYKDAAFRDGLVVHNLPKNFINVI